MRCARLLIFVLALALTGCVGPVKSLYPPRPGEPARTVYVVNHGLHTGVAVERADIPKGVWAESNDYAPAKYLEVGWGPDEPYRAPKLTPRLMLKALFWPNRTVLLLDGFDTPPTPDGDDPRAVIEIKLSVAGFERLCEYVQNAYALDPAGKPIYLGRNFYRARGTYFMFHTCNNWAAAALRKAGCPITPVYCATAGPLLFQARRCGQVIPPRDNARPPVQN